MSFEIRRGETLGLVGESGSGKTTVGRTLLRLTEPTAGRMLFDGTDIFALSERQLRPWRRRMQIIFQDPFSSLNPRLTVRAIITEAIEARGGFNWGGMSISFGADVQTYLDGQLALRTLVSWSASGATTQTIVGTQLSPADMASATGGGGGIAIPQMLSGSQVYFANAGRTALVQNTNGALQNVLVNAMANRNAVQQTNATVTLSNYTAFAAALRNGALNMGLGREIANFTH